eukprot:6416575-Heterocapsa_arctica.AAC.1
MRSHGLPAVLSQGSYAGMFVTGEAMAAAFAGCTAFALPDEALVDGLGIAPAGMALNGGSFALG